MTPRQKTILYIARRARAQWEHSLRLQSKKDVNQMIDRIYTQLTERAVENVGHLHELSEILFGRRFRYEILREPNHVALSQEGSTP